MYTVENNHGDVFVKENGTIRPYRTGEQAEFDTYDDALNALYKYAEETGDNRGITVAHW